MDIQEFITIYHVNPEGFNWVGVDEVLEGSDIPEGWTDVAPPEEATYRLVFDWDNNTWVETATEWQKLGYETEEQMVIAQQEEALLEQLPTDEDRIKQLEEMVIQLLLMS